MNDIALKILREEFIDEECNSAITVEYVNLFFNMV